METSVEDAVIACDGIESDPGSYFFEDPPVDTCDLLTAKSTNILLNVG